MSSLSSRLYINESTGLKEFLVQGSITGGDTSVIPIPFGNSKMFDISPDHSRLLVAESLGPQDDTQVWILPLPTGNPRHLSDIVAHWASWSPDGKQLVFAKGSDIFLANAEGANARKLITVSGRPGAIRFSPDGARLRFTLETPQTNSSSIWEVHVDGSHLHALFPDWQSSLSECCGVWSTDGRYYFFVSGSAEGFNLWAVRESAGLFRKALSQPFQLTNGPSRLVFQYQVPMARNYSQMAIWRVVNWLFMPASPISSCHFFRVFRPKTWTSLQTASGSHTSLTPREPCGAVAWTVVNESNSRFHRHRFPSHAGLPTIHKSPISMKWSDNL